VRGSLQCHGETIAPTRLLAVYQSEFNSLRRLDVESVTASVEETVEAHRAAVRA